MEMNKPTDIGLRIEGIIRARTAHGDSFASMAADILADHEISALRDVASKALVYFKAASKVIHYKRSDDLIEEENKAGMALAVSLYSLALTQFGGEVSGDGDEGGDV